MTHTLSPSLSLSSRPSVTPRYASSPCVLSPLAPRIAGVVASTSAGVTLRVSGRLPRVYMYRYVLLVLLCLYLRAAYPGYLLLGFLETRGERRHFRKPDVTPPSRSRNTTAAVVT